MTSILPRALILASGLLFFPGAWGESGRALAQAGATPEPRSGQAPEAPGRAKLSSRKAPGSSTSRGAPGAGSTAAPAGQSGTGAAPAGGPKAQPPRDAAPAAPGKGLMARTVDFLVAYALWIIIGLAVLLGAIIYFMMRVAGVETAAPPPVVRLPAGEEGPRRTLTVPAAGAESQGDREYALVVKEEDLKMPPLPEEAGPARHHVDAAPIQDLLSKKSFDDAYHQYLQRIETDGQSSFAPELERKLSEHFLQKGDLKKAAKILEHHVATHPADQITPESYFNLGYIHFKGKVLNKSRRYLRLFVERHTDPVQVDRAKKILARLERVHNLN